MNVPKVIFRKMTLEENIDIIKWAFFEDEEDLSVHYYTVEYFPELANIDINAPKEEIYKKISEVVTKDYYQYEQRIEAEVDRYNEIWEKYNDDYFIAMNNFLGCSIPEKFSKVDANVGLIPVFPRYLSKCAFSIGTGVPDWVIVATAAHETLHFLWFEKWRKIHPETPKRHYNSPYFEWKYSEMVTDPILNNAPFNDMFDFVEKGYDSFYELYDNEELVMDKLRKIYATDEDIDIKIEKGYQYLKAYFKVDNKKVK